MTLGSNALDSCWSAITIKSSINYIIIKFSLFNVAQDSFYDTKIASIFPSSTKNDSKKAYNRLILQLYG